MYRHCLASQLFDLESVHRQASSLHIPICGCQPPTVIQWRHAGTGSYGCTSLGGCASRSQAEADVRKHRTSGLMKTRSAPVQVGLGRFEPVQGGPGQFAPVQGGSGRFALVQGGPGRFAPVQSTPGRVAPVQGGLGRFGPVHGGPGWFVTRTELMITMRQTDVTGGPTRDYLVGITIWGRLVLPLE